MMNHTNKHIYTFHIMQSVMGKLMGNCWVKSSILTFKRNLTTNKKRINNVVENR